MTDNLKIIKSFLPPEVIRNLQVKKFSQGEIIFSSSQKKAFYIEKGFVSPVSHYEKKESLLPTRHKAGDIAGLNTYMLYKNKWWEFIASTDVEGFFLSDDILDKYISNNLDAYKTLVKVAASTSEQVLLSLYIQVHGGARALFAYGLVEYSIDNEFQYIKHENITKTLNISRARLHALESEFIQKGFIRKERKKFILLDKEGLRDLYKEFIFME